MLARLLGPDGWRAFMRRYLSAFRLSSVTTPQFTQLLSDFSNSSRLRPFLDSWTRQAGRPVVRIGLDRGMGEFHLSQMGWPQWVIPIWSQLLPRNSSCPSQDSYEVVSTKLSGSIRIESRLQCFWTRPSRSPSLRLSLCLKQSGCQTCGPVVGAASWFPERLHWLEPNRSLVVSMAGNGSRLHWLDFGCYSIVRLY